MAGDPVVKDETGRAAIARVLQAATETQKKAGMPLPDVASAQLFATDVAVTQIKKHEEQAARQGIDEIRGLASDEDANDNETFDTEAKAALDRGEVPDDAVVINRALDAPGMTPAAARHLLPDTRPLEDRLLEARVNMMSTYPHLREELERAWVDGEQKAIHSGSQLDRLDAKRRLSMAADEVLRVVEKWNRVFGDYRFPKANGATKIIMVPREAIVGIEGT